MESTSIPRRAAESDTFSVDGDPSRRQRRPGCLHGAAGSALIALALLATASAQGCSRPRVRERLLESPPRNLLLITIDTLRADRVGCYGHPRARTPHLDRIAAEGVRFEAAVAPAPLTLPSHASLLTGRHPAAHGVRTNGRERLPQDVPTLAEVLAPRLPRRGAVVASVSLDRLFGLDRGFSEYDDRMPPAPPGRFFLSSERRGEEVALLASRWLEGAAEPFLLWVHLFDPHAPYEAPAGWLEQAQDAYDAEVSYADSAVGRILEPLARSGVLERTLLVVAGDHGEDLGEHGEPTHGIFLYDSAVRVPLLFRYPAALPAGRVVRAQVRLIDVMPTVLEALGLDLPAGVQGVSLLPLMAGEKDDLDLEAYLETRLPAQRYGWSALRALRGAGWKYVSAPEEELYDLSSDPEERRNLAATEPGRCAGLRARLEEAEARAGDSQADPARPTGELVRQLESLGYVGGHEGPGPMGAGSDPKRMARLLPAIDRGAAAFDGGEFERARSELQAVLGEDPGNVFSRRLLARSLLALGRSQEGEREYRRLLEAAPSDAEALNALGTLALRAGRFEEAERMLRAAHEASPWDPRVSNNLAYLLVRRGDVTEAERMMAGILAEHPRFVEAALNLAALRRRLGRPAEAERTLRDLLREVPGDPSALRGLAGILKEQGRVEEARRLLEGAAR